MNSRLWLILVLCVPCDVQANAATVDCEQLSELDTDQYVSEFDELRALAIETNAKLCQSMLSQNRAETVRSTVLSYSNAFKEMLGESFDLSEFDMIETQFDYFEDEVANMGDSFDEQALDQMRVGGALTTELFFSQSTPADKRSTIPSSLDSKCARPKGVSKTYKDCKEALGSVSRAFNAYRYAYDQYRFDANQSELEALSQSWERYLEDARSQTLLDVIVTTRLNRHYHKQTKLLPPPSARYFVLRPQIVYEYAGGAAAGDKERIALAVEWGGVNWWDWKIPFGVSAVSIVSDDANVDSVGHGALFTFYNRYSIGWVRRGDENGVFVTIDLLKFVKDKSQTFEQFKSRF